MPTTIDHREAIIAALKDFDSRPIADAANQLFATLGYQSDRHLPITSAKQFRDQLDPASTPKPALAFDGTGLTIEFRYAPEYLKAIAASETPPTEGVTDPVQRVLFLLLQRELAPSALQKAIGLSHRPTFRQNYLRAAENVGLIERTIPDKPNSRLQKYRLTPKGRAWLARQLG